ncbi:sialic acid-binding Ig-like lectin 15 [Hemitrygon akajei]|uniref:sialic acid-binding Ig-like lectin 15 n=1 Tax=Hemitrygon akajei TaxID=2704970 RepID=UPI003BFA36D6
MKGNLPDVSIVFNQTRSSSASPPYTNTVNEGGRYELVGDPERGNASIRVTDLRMNDTSRYFCHIWFEIKRNKTAVIQNEMTLQIDVPATILSLSLVTDDTGATLECRAEGKPPANITWIDLENSTLPMNSSEMRVTGDLESVGKLVLSGLRGSYRCVAMNKHGSDTREIHLAKTGTSALMLARYIVFSTLAIVPLVVFAVWSLKKGSCQRGCCVDSPAASGVKSQTEPAPQRRNLVA